MLSKKKKKGKANKNKKSDRSKKRREAQRKRRAKLKNNPEKYELQKEIERKRYTERVRCGKIKKIADMTEEELNAVRKKNREKFRRYMKRKKEEHINLSVSDEEDIQQENTISTISPPRSARGRKRIRKKIDSKYYRDNLHLKMVNEQLKKKLNATTMKLSRLKKKNSTVSHTQDALQEMPELNELIQNNTVSDALVEKLTEGEVLRRKFVNAYKETRSRKYKKNIRDILKVDNNLNLPKIIRRKVQNIIPYKPKKKSPVKLPKKNVIRIIEKFYEENSQVRPGKNDCITKNKIKKQSCYLNAPLNSLHIKFRNEYPNIKLSYSYFALLRPFWMTPRNSNSRDTCLCVTHENVNLVISKLFANHIIKEKTYQNVINSIVCDSNNEMCMYRKCKSCVNKKVQFNRDLNENEQFCYKKWVVNKENRISAKTKKQITVQLTTKTTIVTTIKEIKSIFQSEILEPFMTHIHRIHHQNKTLKCLKDNLTDADLYIIMDWSENFLCKYGREPQSMHFGASRDQISLHTGMVYAKNLSRGFCTFSKSLRHDALAVIAHLRTVIDYALSKNPSVTRLHIQSDGPTTQYRNKTAFYLMTMYLSKIYGFEEIIYNYTEAGHGKSVADGIGGAVKRLLDRLINYGHDINNFEALITAIKNNSKNYFTAGVSEENIDSLDQVISCTLKLFKGTLKVHQFKWVRSQNNIIRFNEMSCYQCDTSKQCIHYHIGELRYLDVLTETVKKTSRKRKVSTKKETIKRKKKSKK